MTGTERAMLRHALGSLRYEVLRHPERGLDHGLSCAEDALDSCGGSLLWIAIAIYVARRTVPPRILRARVALYLRAVLRQDAIERPLLTCDRCGYSWWGRSPGAGSPCCSRTGGRLRHPRPLWLDAPPHRSEP